VAGWLEGVPHAIESDVDGHSMSLPYRSAEDAGGGTLVLAAAAALFAVAL